MITIELKFDDAVALVTLLEELSEITAPAKFILGEADVTWLQLTRIHVKLHEALQAVSTTEDAP